MLHSVSLLLSLFLRIAFPFFASFIPYIFFTVNFYRPLSVLPLCFLFALPLSFCWYYSCFILSNGSTFIFCNRKDVEASAERADRCVLWSGALPVLVGSWYWFLVLQNIIGTWDVHYRCADCNRAACVRACLSVGMLLLLERRGVAFCELRCKISFAICQWKGTKCRMTNHLGKM